MRVIASTFFSKEDYQDILDVCESTKKHSYYGSSPLVQEKVKAIGNLFVWKGKESIDVDIFMETLKQSRNDVCDPLEKRGMLEIKARAIEEFFVNHLLQPICQLEEKVNEKTYNLAKAHRMIILSKEISLASLIEKVKRVINQYPLKLSEVFIEIYRYEESQENEEVRKFCEPTEADIKKFEDRIEKSKRKLKVLKKSTQEKDHQLTEVEKLKGKITYSKLKLPSTTERLLQTYQTFMQMKNMSHREFFGENGYFKDHACRFVKDRWLRELLVYAKPIDWEKIGAHTRREPTDYTNLISSSQSKNSLIKKLSYDMLNYLRSLSNVDMDEADASGSRFKSEKNQPNQEEGTVGGNRSFVSRWVEEGSRMMNIARTLKWPMFPDKDKIEGLYHVYGLLTHLQTANSSREEILLLTEEEASATNLLSPRPEDPSNGSLTARARDIDTQPIIELNPQLQIDPSLGGKIFNKIFSYLTSIEQAKICFEEIIKNETLKDLIKKEQIDQKKTLEKFDKQIKVMRIKLKEQNLIPFDEILSN